jgi:TraX protein
MNAYQIKWIAIVTMIVDHIGLFFFPHLPALRIIGRLSFPLFAWLIANGAKHTTNIVKYLSRLYFFALFSQGPFFMANVTIDPKFSGVNVLGTLFLGLAAIYIIKGTKDKRIWGLVTIICALIAQYIQTDYGGFGVVSVVLFYVFYDNFLELVTSQLILVLAQIFFIQSNSFEITSLLSLIIIKFYNNEEGIRMKYFFYLFYPVQYALYYAGLLLFT